VSIDETIVTSIGDLETKDENREPCLIIIGGQHIGQFYHLNSDELIGGRSPNCEIWIEDNMISRKHFRIQKQDNKFMIEDLKSTNGTYVNNKRVKTCVLNAGDKIQISKETIIQFDFFDKNRRLSEQKRYEMGVRDAVTGTFNKSYFLQRLVDEFSYASRRNIPLSLMMFDIDHFKLINDSHGHLVGDQVLKEICERIAKTIREEDVFCRYGGEEFVIIMRNTDCQNAVNLAERIRKLIAAKPIVSDQDAIPVTISLGVSTQVDGVFRDYVALLNEADRYLYKSKGAGRNCVSAVCQPIGGA